MLRASRNGQESCLPLETPLLLHPCCWLALSHYKENKGITNRIGIGDIRAERIA